MAGQGRNKPGRRYPGGWTLRYVAFGRVAAATLRETDERMYFTPAGVAKPGSGIELKDRDPSMVTHSARRWTV